MCSLWCLVCCIRKGCVMSRAWCVVEGKSVLSGVWCAVEGKGVFSLVFGVLYKERVCYVSCLVCCRRKGCILSGVWCAVEGKGVLCLMFVLIIALNSLRNLDHISCPHTVRCREVCTAHRHLQRRQ